MISRAPNIRCAPGAGPGAGPGARFTERCAIDAASGGTASVEPDVVLRGTDPVALAAVADGARAILAAARSESATCGVTPRIVAPRTRELA